MWSGTSGLFHLKGDVKQFPRDGAEFWKFQNARSPSSEGVVSSYFGCILVFCNILKIWCGFSEILRGFSRFGLCQALKSYQTSNVSFSELRRSWELRFFVHFGLFQYFGNLTWIFRNLTCVCLIWALKIEYYQTSNESFFGLGLGGIRFWLYVSIFHSFENTIGLI